MKHKNRHLIIIGSGLIFLKAMVVNADDIPTDVILNSCAKEIAQSSKDYEQYYAETVRSSLSTAQKDELSRKLQLLANITEPMDKIRTEKLQNASVRAKLNLLSIKISTGNGLDTLSDDINTLLASMPSINSVPLAPAQILFKEDPRNDLDPVYASNNGYVINLDPNSPRFGTVEACEKTTRVCISVSLRDGTLMRLKPGLQDQVLSSTAELQRPVTEEMAKSFNVAPPVRLVDYITSDVSGGRGHCSGVWASSPDVRKLAAESDSSGHVLTEDEIRKILKPADPNAPLIVIAATQPAAAIQPVSQQAQPNLTKSCVVNLNDIDKVEALLTSTFKDGGPLIGGSLAQVSLGESMGCAVNSEGRTSCWSIADSFYDRSTAWDVRSIEGNFNKSISCGDNCLALSTNSALTEAIRGPYCRLPLASFGTNTSATSFEMVKVNSQGTACGLKSDGYLVCWGNTSNGLGSPPISTFSDFSMGDPLSCGVTTNGKVSCWGLEIDKGPTSSSVSTALNGDGKTKLVKVIAKGQHACAITDSGVVRCDDAYMTSKFSGKFKDLALGSTHSCGIKVDGSVHCFGDNSNGMSLPQPGKFVSIAVNSQSTCGTLESGVTECWGKPISSNMPMVGAIVSTPNAVLCPATAWETDFSDTPPPAAGSSTSLGNTPGTTATQPK